MSTPAPPYRDATNEVASLAKRLLAEQRDTDLDKLGTLYSHRMARICFGWGGSFAAIVALIVIAFAEHGQAFVLGMAWVAAFAGGIAGFLVAAFKFKRMRERYESVSDDPYALVLRLTKASDTDDEGPYSLHRIDELRLDSHRLPLLVGALLLPLTTIVCFMLLCGTRVQELDLVARYGFLYTIHVHIYAAVAAWRFPKKRNSAAIIGIAALFGVIPFIVSGLVVCVVALVIVIFFFVPISWWVDSESQWIDCERQERIDAKLRPPQQTALLPLASAALTSAPCEQLPKNRVAAASPL